MAGFDLKEGKYDDRVVSEDELWAAVANVFTSKSKNDASYKYGFFKSILDTIHEADTQLFLSFDQIFYRFTEIYWSLILKYHLRQKAITKDNRKTEVERALIEARDKYGIQELCPFNGLPQKVKDAIAHKVKMKCKTYVVGALYEDTKRLFYSFSKKEGWIQINPRMYEFVCTKKPEIEKLNMYEWAHFIEKVNKDHCACLILSDCFEGADSPFINTFEILFEAEEADQKRSKLNIQNNEQSYNSFPERIDDRIIALLDDPEQLIKVLRKTHR